MMSTPGASDGTDPIIDGRGLLACLDFHLTELDRLLGRGLITAESHATASAETRERLAALSRRLVEDAERDQTPTPSVVVHPATEAEPTLFRLSEARAALQRGDDAEVVTLCLARLVRQPDHYDATVILAFARQRQGRLEDALTLYRKLVAVEPENRTWALWVRTIETRMAARKDLEPAVVLEPVRAPMVAPPFLAAGPAPWVKPAPEAPRVSWSGVASEFLQDHWQKLILCMAVLLIVVSSNVGAYQLLGPKLWSPVGKCVLALVYTAMFAGLGAFLVRWGAERAGRIMLLTTLIVVPANFMLLGQMRLLTTATGYNLAVVGIDAVALFLLIRLVTTSLTLGSVSGFLSASLFVLSAFNAAAMPGSPWPWGWQFAVFLVPAAVFLGSVAWLSTRVEAEPFEGRMEATYFALGLLAFAYVSGLIRTGAFAIELVPALYAFPVMVGALACVITSDGMERFDDDARRKQWMRFAGLVLSGLAFALAVARPPGLSAVLSGNTLATALVGLGIYGALLRRVRRPAYLYVGFAALVVAAWGASYFARHRLHAVEEIARQVLGYRTRLPVPFQAVRALIFSPILAAFSIYLRRAWKDARLARHCHYLGVPLSVAACVFSTFEPKAAVVVLSGYALLYAVAVRAFSAPLVLYLATAAFAGAVYFGSTLYPGSTPALQAFAGASLGFGYWALAAVFRARGVDARYQRPLGHAALGVSVLALFWATSAVVWVPGGASFTASGAFLIVALTAFLVNRDVPTEDLACLAVVCVNMGLALLMVEAGTRARGWLSFGELAAMAAALGLAGAALAGWFRGVVGDDGPPGRLAVYPRSLEHVAFVLLALVVGLCGVHTDWMAEQLRPADFLAMAAALAMAGVALGLLLRTYPAFALAHLALGGGLGVWLCLVQAVHGGVLDSLAAYGATCSAYAVALIAAEEFARALSGKTKGARDPDFPRAVSPRLDVFAAALPGFEVTLVLAAVGLAVSGFRNGPEVIVTFAAGSIATLWATRFRRSEGLVHLSLALAVAACVCVSGWRVGWADGGYGIAWTALTTAGCGLVFRLVGRWCASGDGLALYVKPCWRASALLSWPVMVLAVGARADTLRAFPVSVAGLGLNALTLAMLAGDVRRSRFTYRSVVSAVLAVYVVVFSVGKANPDNGYFLGLVAVGLAFVGSAVGLFCRSRRDEFWETLYASPLFRSAMVLTTLAVFPAHRSPWTMLAVGVSFLVLVKGLPSRLWIYASVASWACGVYFGVLAHRPPETLVTAGMVAAYQLWLIGLLVRQAEPALVRRLNLPSKGYDYPFFNSAAVFCLLAVILRAEQTRAGSGDWSESAGLMLNVAGFLMLMIKPYPDVAWVHGSVALASLGFGLAAYPKVQAEWWWLTLGMALANLWAVVARVFRRYSSPVCRRLGITEGGYADAVEFWSRGFFNLTTTALAGLVALGVGGSLLGAVAVAEDVRGGAWWGALASIALGAVYVGIRWWGARRDRVVVGLSGLIVMAVWWLAAPISPLVTRYGLNPLIYLPLATAFLSLTSIALGLSLVNRTGWRGPFWRTDAEGDPVARLDAFALQAGLALAVVAAAMTRAEDSLTTVGTLWIAMASLGLAAVARRWVAAGYAGGLTWCASGLFAARVLAHRLGDTSDPDLFIMMAVALIVTPGVLWVFAGLLRRGLPRSEPGTAARLPAGTVFLALEQVALGVGGVAAGLIGASLLGTHEPGRNAAMAAVLTLFGLALLVIGLIVRWGEASLVYAAHGSILGGYLYYRHAFPLLASADVAVFSLIGFLDLGIAEALQRAGLGRYSRPTRYFSLALPLVPLALGLFDTGLGGSRLFFLFAAGSFYGIAWQAMGWRSLGYAAAVLYNAFLWLLWSRIGWTLSDRPQFFLVPVGLSAVLFGEAERRNLGRQAANAIRGVGLSVVYLSLAFPVYEYSSLGAWATLLLLSLAGVFAGIGLRVQVFLWLGLSGFTLDVVYQLGRMGLEHTLAKWAIMLGLGLLLFLFVALNEKKRIVPTLRDYLEQARGWD